MKTARLREAEPATRFARSYRNARRAVLGLSENAARRLDSVVLELRADIRDRLAALPPREPLAARVLPEIDASISRSLDDLLRRTGEEVRAGMRSAFELGEGATSGAFRAAGISVATPTVSPEVLSSLTGTFEDVLSEMVDGLGRQLSRETRLAAAGLRTPSQTMRRVTDLLRTSAEVRKGVRRRIGFAFQAEEIARTEIGRVFSNAQQAASEAIEARVPTLRKRWATSPLNTRRGHREVAESSAEKPLRVRERFRVRDYSRTGSTRFVTFGDRAQPRHGVVPGLRVARVDQYVRRGRVIEDRMLFPRDPAGSPGNVVNCTCTVIEVVPDLEKAGRAVSGVLAER